MHWHTVYCNGCMLLFVFAANVHLMMLYIQCCDAVDWLSEKAVTVLFQHIYFLEQGSANFLGSRAGYAPKELAAGQTRKFYVKNLITVD